MQNFPHFDHFAVKLLFAKEELDNTLTDKILEKLVKELKLTVLDEFEYKFIPYGLTKVSVLSQSHLIVHTWPEFGAVHLDLMTCAKDLNFAHLGRILEEFKPQEMQIEELRY